MISSHDRGSRVPLRLLILCMLVGTGFALAALHDWRHGTLWLIALALGATLWGTSFSFVAAYRQALIERRTAGVRAQLLMLAAAVCLFLPALGAGEILGQPVRGFVFSFGCASLAGAFMFGVGMQLGGGCGSGTLYAAGGGAVRSWLTLAAFVVGATAAAGSAGFWLEWPALPPFSLLIGFGFWPTLAGSLLLLSSLAVMAAHVELARHGDVQSVFGVRATSGRRRFHPWSLGLGALAVAGLSFLTLAVAGRPWAITAAFPLWGAKAIEASGFDDPAFWTYWDDPTRTEALLRPLSADRTTVMDLGLIAGAFLAAMLASRLPVRWNAPHAGAVFASLIGGLLLGFGAVLAAGCNISAFLGGVASGSLHGWIWIVPALLGNAVGLWLRPLFRLETSPGLLADSAV